jgi:transcriptional regulator with XRE-family HTH domain
LISTKKGIIIRIGGDDMQSINLIFIKTRRKELGLTLQQMSDSLGFKKATTYSNYENGDRIMKANMLPTLAQILQCDIMDFFTK